MSYGQFDQDRPYRKSTSYPRLTGPLGTGADHHTTPQYLAPMDSSSESPRLTINLVPRSQWGANLHQSLRGPRWDTLRQETYRRAGYRCEVCGPPVSPEPVRHGRIMVAGPPPPVLEAHEVWEYDESTGTQRLVRLVALCPACHEVQHFGFASVRGRAGEATAHLMEVNGWDEKAAKAHIAEATAVWKRRNEIAWTLDLSVLADYGVTPPTADELNAGAAARRNQLRQSPRRAR